MIVDTHAHIQFNAYREDSDAVIERALAAGVAMIAPSSQIDTSKRSIEYAEKWDCPFLYAAVGLHPIHLEDSEVDSDEVGEQAIFRTRKEEFRRELYEDLLSSSKVVAIGEVGLDYWRKPKSKAKREEYIARQHNALIQQLSLATDYDLPVILHCRVAHSDLIDILNDHAYIHEVGGNSLVSHSFTGDREHLDALLSMGAYIGVNGLVFKLDMVQDAVVNTPLERIVLETDAPYLSPPNAPERNEPCYMTETAQRVADIKRVSIEEVEEITTQNAINLFRLPLQTSDMPEEHRAG